jgi:hypothetical protein
VANCGICSWYVLVFEIISVLFFYCGIAYVPYSTMQSAATIIFFNDLHDGGSYSGSSKRMNFD